MADFPSNAPQMFQLGATVDPNAASQAYAQTANATSNALRMGSDIQAQRQQMGLQQQQMQLEQQKFAQQKQQEEVTSNLAKFGQLTGLYKNTHKSLRPKLWNTIATQANQMLGTQLDPNIMPETANDSIEAAHQEIQNLLDKKQSFGDTMKKLGMLSVDLDEETRKAVESSKDFLLNTPEGQKLKNEGKGEGSYTFAGYDPTTKQPIFSYSKAPVLVNGQGAPHSGPIQSKADLDTTTQEIRKLDNISSSVDDLGKLLDQVPAGAKGGMQAVVTAVPGGNLIYQQAAQYQDQIPAIAVTFYRASTGDTRLSDDDARKRAIPFMPRIQDTEDVRAKKIEVIKAMLQRRKDGLSQGVFEVPFDPNHADVKVKPQTERLSSTAKDLISKWENK